VQAGDPISEQLARERLESLWNAHYADVLAFGLRRLADREAADDVAAETFLVAWRRLDAIPPEAVRPWLLGVANKVIANSRRGRRRTDALIAKLERTHVTAANELPEQTGTAVAAFNRLKSRDREVLALVVWEDLAPWEAATVLGIPTSKFSVRLHRAKRRLRKELERAGHPVDEEGDAASAESNLSAPAMETR
jgi:RNA polymerase sigma-70 factor, ECF subfamily